MSAAGPAHPYFIYSRYGPSIDQESTPTTSNDQNDQPPPLTTKAQGIYAQHTTQDLSDYNSKKRKREESEEMTTLFDPRPYDKVLKKDGDVSAPKEAPFPFKDREHLMEALQNKFLHDQHVDFAGCYKSVEQGKDHKQCIQMITHEIWKATGYRFTVKDHPRIKGGHKTRLWCSQDNAHAHKPKARSQNSRASAGALDVQLKARYPCRSRLLISSRDTDSPHTRLVTVRMHHHVAHDPYLDANSPLDVSKAVTKRVAYSPPSTTSTSPTMTSLTSPGSSNNVPSAAPNSWKVSTPSPAPEPHSSGLTNEPTMESKFWSKPAVAAESVPQPNGPMMHTSQPQASMAQSVSHPARPHHPQLQHSQHSAHQHLQSLPHPMLQTQSQHPQSSPHTPSPTLPLENTLGSPIVGPQPYHERLRRHIENLRTYCEMLEYQVHLSNDPQILLVLEQEAGAFLKTVEDRVGCGSNVTSNGACAVNSPTIQVQQQAHTHQPNIHQTQYLGPRHPPPKSHQHQFTTPSPVPPPSQHRQMSPIAVTNGLNVTASQYGQMSHSSTSEEHTYSGHAIHRHAHPALTSTQQQTHHRQQLPLQTHLLEHQQHSPLSVVSHTPMIKAYYSPA
ncbi:hypothetical protein BDN72DRAFT_214723 [Pluteus cervinus]|uniref:Uncharacterized protein n=1 Tax=Pluteus cervinus TaxID=181527 RepID=A0ACD3B643_9AGAR|nr:hypothetical protein BDN72DRAFT_214723 [Pluteus cervinus]